MKAEVQDDVEESPVFLSSCNEKQEELFLLQYPVHSAHSRKLDGHITEARLRPECREMFLKRRIPTNSVYDEGKGEELALNADGPHRDTRDNADDCFPSGFMDESVMHCDGSRQNVSRYAVGLLVPGQGLVMVPLNAILPMLPVLDYIDKADERVKKDKKAEEEAEEGTTENDTSRAVTVRFERAENEKMKNARERSYTHHQRQIQEEPWVTMAYAGSGDSNCAHLREMLFDNVDTKHMVQFHLPPSHFISMLVPPSMDHSIKTGTSVSAVELAPLDISKSALHSYTIDKQIEKIMRKVQVAYFREILELLEPELGRTDSSLIDKVQASATLVQGCWVLKSDLLYPTVNKESTATNTAAKELPSSRRHTVAGTPHEVMQKARDFALYLLNKHGFLTRDDLTPVMLPGKDLLKMLRGIALPQPSTKDDLVSKRWLFRLPRDDHFIARNKDLNQRYFITWDHYCQTAITPR